MKAFEVRLIALCIDGVFNANFSLPSVPVPPVPLRVPGYWTEVTQPFKAKTGKDLYLKEFEGEGLFFAFMQIALYPYAYIKDCGKV